MYIMSILCPAFTWFLRAFLGMATRSMALVWPLYAKRCCSDDWSGPHRWGKNVDSQNGGGNLFHRSIPSRELTYPPKNGILKMIFLFPRWDMLIPWKVLFEFFSTVFNCSNIWAKSFSMACLMIQK